MITLSVRSFDFTYIAFKALLDFWIGVEVVGFTWAIILGVSLHICIWIHSSRSPLRLWLAHLSSNQNEEMKDAQGNGIVMLLEL